MFKNKFFQLLIVAALIVGGYLIVNAVGPKVGASSVSVAPVGIGELRQFEASQAGVAIGASSSAGMGDLRFFERGGVKSFNSGSSLSPQALDAWAARYAGQAAGLTSETALSSKALAAWAARYTGEASALGAGAPMSAEALAAWAARYQGQAKALSGAGSLSSGGEWNPDAFYAGGGG